MLEEHTRVCLEEMKTNQRPGESKNTDPRCRCTFNCTGKQVQQSLETCRNIHGNTAYKKNRICAILSRLKFNILRDYIYFPTQTELSYTSFVVISFFYKVILHWFNNIEVFYPGMFLLQWQCVYDHCDR